jgi:hypothetical protein
MAPKIPTAMPAGLCSPKVAAVSISSLMVDGVYVGEHTCVVALGIGRRNAQHQ